MEAMTKSMLFWNTDVEDVEVKNPENKINAVIEYSADRSYVDIKYQTPTQNVSMINIDLPMDVQPASALFPWSPARLVGLVSARKLDISRNFSPFFKWNLLRILFHFYINSQINFYFGIRTPIRLNTALFLFITNNKKAHIVFTKFRS